MLVNVPSCSSHSISLPEWRYDSPNSIELTEFSFVYKGKSILTNISAIFPGGTLTCILGPSGSGKTTLLNSIGGRTKRASSHDIKVTLTLSVNGRILDPAKFKSKFRFVQAHECLFTMDTPREVLLFAAKLRLHRLPRTQQDDTVTNLLRSLRLEACKDAYIGSSMTKGVSSGEKKRTVIARELLGDCTILLLDEPTTGLDSFTAYELIAQLKDIVLERNICVIAVIHQPSMKIFQLFHNVMFLTRSGVVYHGPVELTEAYFASCGYSCAINTFIADYIIFLSQTLGDGAIEDLVNMYVPIMARVNREILDLRRLVATRNQAQIFQYVDDPAPWHKQLLALAGREYRLIMRDIRVLVLRIAPTFVFALLIAFMFFQVGTQPGGALNYNHGSLVFTLVTLAVLSVGQGLMVVYAVETPIVASEIASGLYTSFIYSISKDVLEYPVMIFNVLLYLTLAYLIGGMQGSFLLLLLGMLLISFCGAAISFLVASGVDSVEIAAIYSAHILVLQELFSGYFVVSSQIPPVIGWMQWINPLRYGLAICYIGEFRNIPGHDQLFDQYNVNSDLLLGYIFILVGLYLVFRACGVFAIHVTSQEKSISDVWSRK